MRKITFSILGFLFLSMGYSQTVSLDSLQFWSSKFLDKKIDDKAKADYNEKFIKEFCNLLEQPGSFDISFDSLKNISVKTPPDKNFRIFTWFTLNKSGYQSYGIVQSVVKKSKSFVVTRLYDNGEDLRSAQFKTLNAKSWYGALYYDMIPFKIKGKKYYAVLGYNPGDGLSHKKVIDVIQLTANGQPRFGAAVFEKDEKTASRIILEYDARAKVSLRFDETNDRFVFDHLVPPRPELVDQYHLYIPDMSYDAFSFGKNTWEYKPDVDARNEDENLGSQGTRLVIDGVNDQKTLEDKMSGGGNDKKNK